MNMRGSSQAPIKLSKYQEEEESYITQTKIIKEIHVSAEGLNPIDQLKDFILDAIEDKFKSLSEFSLVYKKMYTQTIDNLNILNGCQPSNLQ